MILAIDIGNTNIVIGCIDENKTYFVERLRTDSSKTAREYALDLKNVLELYGITREDLNGSIVASVVPPVSTTIRQAMEKVTGQKPLMVGPGVRTGLNIKVDNPASVGADLIVAAVAAVRDYPAPLIIIDMGTATTMTVVDRNGNYIGGVIIPGLQVALDSLVNRAAQLTKISLDVPSQVIGRNTLNCMQSGSLYGTAAMIDGMIDRMEAELGEPATVVATGGLARFVMPLCNHQIQMDDGLLLKGLWIIYQKNQ